jgi:hypothetical protein
MQRNTNIALSLIVLIGLGGFDWSPKQIRSAGLFEVPLFPGRLDLKLYDVQGKDITPRCEWMRGKSTDRIRSTNRTFKVLPQFVIIGGGVARDEGHECS